MATAPYNIIAGPANVYVAPLATAFPAVNVDPAGAGWTYLGWTEGGVKAKHGQNIELLRVDQNTGPVKAIRSEESLELSTSLAELTLENFGIILNNIVPTVGSTKAVLTTALAGTNDDLQFVADTAGVAGNSIRVRYVVSGISTPLSVSVSVNDITVNVQTNGAGAAISTAAQVMAAVIASGPANALVDTFLAAGSDGTGVVSALAFTNLAGGAASNTKKVGLRQGLDAVTYALLIKGPSPYGNFNLQYEVPIVVQVEEPEVEFVRDDKAVLACSWNAIEDSSAATAVERFGRLIAQTA